MKKTYEKPDIMYENFSMSTNIAAGCEEKANYGEYICGVKWGEGAFTLFTDAIFACKTKVVDGSGEYDSLCYHNPTSENNVFIS
jgi:hypothetical protein